MTLTLTFDLDLEKFVQGQNVWNILIKENCECMGGTVPLGGCLRSPNAFLAIDLSHEVYVFAGVYLFVCQFVCLFVCLRAT